MRHPATVPPSLDAETESARLAALRGLRIMDTLPEQAFDDLVWLASKLCDVPIALVSLVDEERQWFKARCGLDAQQTSREVAFCAHALASDDILEVEDALADTRFASNPLVLGPPHIRFYAGAPLLGHQGHRFGTLCVIDTRPRQLDANQREGLVRLARRASQDLEARRRQFLVEERECTTRQLLESLPEGVVTCDANGVLGEFNQTAQQWHGVDVRDVPPQEWAQHFDLYDASGSSHLAMDEIPLLRAWKGEHVREARIVIRAKGQATRYVSCSADPLLDANGAPSGAVCVMHDVTQLVAAQEEALVDNQRFAGAFASASQGMALVSIEGRWLEVNDALCAMLGYTREELLELDLQRLTHPQDLQDDLGLVTDLLAGQRAAYHLDKRYIHRNGQTVPVHLSVSLVRDAKGRPLHFVSQMQDLSERHRSEQRLRSVLENSYDAFISIDETQAIVEWNRAAEATFGWRRNEVLGKPMAEVIVPPQLRRAHLAGMQRFLQTGHSRVLDQRLELPAWHRSGREFPVEITISAVEDGSRRLFNAFMHDISERRASEEKLRMNEQHIRTIADNVPALIAHVGPDLRYTFVNRPYAAWFAKTSEEIVGLHMSEVLRPEHFAGVRDKLDQVLAGRAVSFEMDVVTHYGEVRHMQASYIPDEMHLAGKEHRGFHLMVHDVTAQVRLARIHEERALKDELTGLPNRAAWAAEMEKGIARARQAGTPVIMMFLDLDAFKQINDTHGHSVGDAVLREFAVRLRASLRGSDFIARLSGDEFVVLLDSVAHPERDLDQVAGKIFHAMEPELEIQGSRIRIRPSIGFAVQQGPQYDASLLMHRADEAMYEAKKSKGGQHVIRQA